MKVALITGITGQDGSYLAEFLLEKGYEVHGIRRRSSSFNTKRIDHLYKGKHASFTNFYLHYGDLTDSANISNLIFSIQPDEVYNLAAQSHVHVSFELPEYTANVDALGTLRILESIRSNNLLNKTKFYQASTSELFGKVQEVPQTEKTPFYPRSPYACAKLFSYWITVNYREAYGMFSCNGILFNHESSRRGETFVTRKITRTLCRIILGLDNCLYLGNLNSLRDWGHARDYVKMQWLMLQQDKPRDFVIATGHQYSVRDFVTKAAFALGITITWSGKEIGEIGIIESIDSSKILKIYNKAEIDYCCKPGDIIVKVDPRYFRPSEVETLLGDATLAKNKLGWEPSINFDDMITEMISNDLLESLSESLTKNI